MSPRVYRRGPYADGVEEPITFWPTPRDEAHLAIIESTGLTREEAIRTAITLLAGEYTPVAWALSYATP